MALLAWLDGAVMPAEQARIPATDDGLLRGDGIFEVIRCYAGPAVRPARPLRAHGGVGRETCAWRLDLDAGARDVDDLLAAQPGHDGVVRVLVTRGGHRLALLEPLPMTPPVVRLGTVTYAPTRILDGVKSLSYAGNMLAGRLARERGFDEALLVTPHGRVLEAPTSSFFWVRDGELLTPPLEDHILASITRARVMEITGARELPCALDDLVEAEEAFLSSTVREVQPVGGIDERELATVGPRTQETALLLRERIAGELDTA